VKGQSQLRENAEIVFSQKLHRRWSDLFQVRTNQIPEAGLSAVPHTADFLVVTAWLILHSQLPVNIFDW